MSVNIKKQTLSVILITRNEAHTIVDCLKSVQFADEIIVLDSGSNDDTVRLAQPLATMVQVTDWPGYGQQKNRALALAHSDWILAIDADERVTPSLQAEIEQLLQQPSTFTAYWIPFTSSFLGHPIKYGDWSHEKHIRLFQRQHAKFNEVAVHEDLMVSGAIGQLYGVITHEPYRDWHEIQAKIERYAQAGAISRHQQGKTANWLSPWIHGWWSFLRSYVWRGGFLDGRPGLWLAVSIAQYSFRRYDLLRKM